MQHLVSARAQQAAQLQEWILSRRFLDYENSAWRLHGERGRERSRLYKISIAIENAPLVMKVSEISSNYKWRRRLELHVQHWFKDYNRNAFHACSALHGRIAEVVEPLAWWSYYSSFAHKKSYFLYRFVQVDCSILGLYEKLQGENEKRLRLNRLAEKWLALVVAIHKAAWRHGDPNPKNIGIQFQNHPGHASPIAETEMQNSRLHLFDYDQCRPARLNKPDWIKLFFDLRCLRVIDIPGLSNSKVVQLYLQQRQPAIGSWKKRLAVWAAAFWKAGGFSPLQRLHRFRKYKKGRHLRRNQ